MSERYPRLEINTNYPKENVEAVIKRCEKCNVTITGIIKGVNGIPGLQKHILTVVKIYRNVKA